jgi:hypothetical protein
MRFQRFGIGGIGGPRPKLLGRVRRQPIEDRRANALSNGRHGAPYSDVRLNRGCWSLVPTDRAEKPRGDANFRTSPSSGSAVREWADEPWLLWVRLLASAKTNDRCATSLPSLSGPWHLPRLRPVHLQPSRAAGSPTFDSERSILGDSDKNSFKLS